VRLILCAKQIKVGVCGPQDVVKRRGTLDTIYKTKRVVVRILVALSFNFSATNFLHQVAVNPFNITKQMKINQNTGTESAQLYLVCTIDALV
jgi:hypothetical protein